MSRPSHKLFTVSQDSDGKNHWHQVGVAWPNKAANTFTLEFSSIPTANDRGKVVVSMFINENKIASEANRTYNTKDLNDEIPV